MGKGGEGVFIGPESSGRPAKVAYVQYLSIAVQRLFRMSRYYSKGIPKSSVRPILFDFFYYSPSTIVLSVSGRPVGDHRTSILKDKGVRPPTLAYIWSRSPISQNALLVDPSDPKSKLTL
jgi:hypothetical protein